MNSTYIPSCLRNQPKQKAKPRKQAIKDAKAEVIDQAIQLLREELRSGKLEGMMMPYQRGYLSAVAEHMMIKDQKYAYETKDGKWLIISHQLVDKLPEEFVDG